jgi:hypothetical protein
MATVEAGAVERLQRQGEREAGVSLRSVLRLPEQWQVGQHLILLTGLCREVWGDKVEDPSGPLADRLAWFLRCGDEVATIFSRSLVQRRRSDGLSSGGRDTYRTPHTRYRTGEVTTQVINWSKDDV